MAYDYIKRTYSLAFTPGDRVRHTVTGNIGTVKRIRGDSHYVKVAFDGRIGRSPCHPEELQPAPAPDSEGKP